MNKINVKLLNILARDCNTIFLSTEKGGSVFKAKKCIIKEKEALMFESDASNCKSFKVPLTDISKINKDGYLRYKVDYLDGSTIYVMPRSNPLRYYG